jgi:hypothetical protein
MSPLRPQQEQIQSQSPSSVKAMCDNRSFAALRMELGDEAGMLQELRGAAPDRLLYGDMLEGDDQLWCYFTLLGGGDNYSKQTGSNRMVCFYTLKGAQIGDSPVHPGQIKNCALASQPFKNARGQWEVLAIAKYFFIKHGVDQGLDKPLSITAFKSDLLKACGYYKAAHDRQELLKKAAAGVTGSAAGAPTEPARLGHGQHRVSERTRYEYRRASSGSQYTQGSASSSGLNDDSRATVTSPHESMAPPSRRQSSELPTGPVNLWQSPSQSFHVDNTRKRTGSLSSYTNGQPQSYYSPSTCEPQHQYSFSPTLAYNTPSAQPAPAPLDRETTMERYIALQLQEEELDHKIREVEDQRSEAAAEMVGLQARLDEVSDKKWNLMDEKDKTKIEKRRLQGSLEREDQLEFGFEVGRRMARESEGKRVRRE